MTTRRAASLWLLACLAAGALMLSPGRAWSAPSWFSPVNLSARGSNNGASGPRIAVDSVGDVVAVWYRFDGSHWIVQSTSKPAGGAWATPVDLSAGDHDAGSPQIAIDHAGNAIAVWNRYYNGEFVVQSASKPAGGTWGQPVDISTVYSAAEPDVALDAAGNAVAVWTDVFDGVVQAAIRSASGAWQSPVDLSAENLSSSDVRVAVDPAGDAVAIWDSYDEEHEIEIVQSARMPAGGAWSTPVNLGPGNEPQIATAATGDAVAIWSTFEGDQDIIRSAVKPAGGGWGMPTDLSAPGLASVAPMIAVNASGDAVAVWELFINGTIQGATKSAGGSWTTPTNLSSPASSVSAKPTVTIDPGGNSVATWTYADGSKSSIQSTSRAKSGTWQPPVRLSTAGISSAASDVGIDSEGNPTAVWQHFDGAEDVIQAASATGNWTPLSEDISEPVPDNPGPSSPGQPASSSPAGSIPPSRGTVSGCSPITLIGVRGSDEREGTFGKPVGAFARALAHDLGMRLDFGAIRPVPLFYPAPPGKAIADPIHGTTRLGQTGYSHSIAVGQRRIHDVFRFDHCRRHTRYVLAGYSQGAQVIGDAIEHHKLGSTKARIFATVFFGDPKFDARLRRATFFGSYRRSKQGVLGGRLKKHGRGRNLFAGYNVLSYCRRLDPFCQGNKRRILEGIIAKGQYAAHEAYQHAEAQEAAKRVALEWRRRR